MILETDIDTFYPASLLIPEFENPYGKEEYINRLSQTPHLILIYKVLDEIAGFKIGYQLDSKRFYSWMGGVLPDYRKQGIAWELAKYQETWLMNHGYETLIMKTRNEHRNMIHFAIKNGFMLTAVEEEQNKLKSRIWLEKSLKP